MKYAVIKTGGKQYRVSEGDVLEVERLVHDGKTITFPEVLLYVNGPDSLVGAPLLSDVMVTAAVVGDVKGEKLRVSKFKSKVRYRRIHGHRQALTQVKITEIRGKNDRVSEVSKVSKVSGGELKKTEPKPERKTRVAKKTEKVS